MAEQWDLVIRNGSIVDGSGAPAFIGDVAISGDRIAQVGTVVGSGREEIDATDMLVTPGFVDIHTHYDGQLVWADRLTPSAYHGVTTVLAGNCGVGFAPCRAEDRDRLIKLMEGVEDIPGIVLAEGLTWEWESYPEYLDAIDRPHDINFATYLPHSAVRVYVMGERAAAGETATPADLAKMADITRDAMRAGALGFSSSRTLFHKSTTGDQIPTLDAGELELLTVAQAMQSEGDGILQVATDYKTYSDVPGEFAMLRRVVETTDRLLALPLTQGQSRPDTWREILGLVGEANADGVKITAQILPRGIGMMYGLPLTMHPFTLCPSYQAIRHLPARDQADIMRDPDMKARILAEIPNDPTMPLLAFVREFGNMFELTDPIDYEPTADRSIAARAAAAGVEPEDLAYDLLLDHPDGPALFLLFANYANGSLDPSLEQLRHPNVVPGLGDGGAHYGVICDASYSTFMLSHWSRDRSRGDKLSVPQAIHAMTQATAHMAGLLDRGLLAPGYKADINIIDHGQVRLRTPTVVFDLPAGGRRLMQQADGFVATIVNGQVAYRDGKPTDRLAGRLVRGRQPAPTPELIAEAA